MLKPVYPPEPPPLGTYITVDDLALNGDPETDLRVFQTAARAFIPHARIDCWRLRLAIAKVEGRP